MSETIKILIIIHKPYPVVRESCYLPIFVGAAGGKEIPEGTVRDDEGENISAKNGCFCELTGLYWAWKNLEADYVGLVHYRRYFRGKGRGKKTEKILREDRLRALLGEHSVLLPKKRRYFIETLYSHYAHTMSADQLDITREIIAEREPDYLGAFDAAMHRRSGYLFNMFVMRRDLFDRYCAWLFPILFELERRVDKTDMSEFDLRFCGRVSERLLNVWLSYMLANGELQKRDCAEVPVIYMEKTHFFRKVRSFLMAKFLHKKYDRSF